MFARSSDARSVVAVATTAEGARAVADRATGRVVTYVAAGVAATAEFERMGLQSLLLARYQDLAWVARINAFAAEVARGFWKLPGLEPIAHVLDDEGTGVAAMLELPVYHVVASAARSVLTAQRLIDDIRPARVVIEEPPLRAGGFWVGFEYDLALDAISVAASAYGAELEIVRTAAPEPAAERVALPVGIPRRVVRAVAWRLRAPLRRRERARTSVAPSPPPGGGILVYAEGRHAYPVLPVIHELASVGLQPVVVDQDLPSDVRAELVAAGIALVDPAQAPASGVPSRLAARAAEAWRDVGDAPALTSLGRRDLGVSIWPIVRFQFDWIFEGGFAEVERRLALARATAAWAKPAALVTPVDASVNDLAWVSACRDHGAPVVAQLHGAVYSEPSHDLWGRGEADVTAVWGELTKTWHLAATSRPPAAFPCVGYPRFDALERSRPDASAVRAARAELGIENEVAVLLLVSMAGGALGSYYRSPLDIYDAFFGGMERLEDAVPVVRWHPASDGTVGRVATARYAGRVVVDGGGSLERLLAAVDVVVGQPTTALLEAMVIGRPVIVWAAGAADEILWWRRHAQLAVAASPDELAVLVDRLAAPGADRDAALRAQAGFLDRLAGPRDGWAARRTAEVVRAAVARK